MATGLSLYGDGEEDSIFLTKDEAMDTEVLPRSRGLSLSSRTAIPVPRSSAVMTDEKVSAGSDFVTHEDLIGLSRKPIATDVASPTDESQEFVTHEDLLGLPKKSVLPVGTEKPKEETGDFLRGGSTALQQTPALAMGALGFVGATGEKLFGTGGAMTSLKNYGLSEYGRRMKEIGETAKDTDDVTKAWDKAKQGDLGALVDWAQYGVGYLGGNIVETVATSALGSLIGGATAGPVGAVAGAGAGVVGRQAVQGVAKNLIEGMVAKEAAKLAEKEGVELATEQMVKQATKTVAKNIGSGTALVGSGIIKETGGIYGEAAEEARAEGRELTGGDLARIFGSGVVAGLSEAAVDRLGLDVAAGKINIPGAGRPGRALIGGVAGVGIEGGQELFQTAIERFGAGKDLTGEDAMNEYINAFALGGLGGGTIGAAVGAFRGGKTDANRVRQILDQAQSDLTSDDGRQELFDAMFDDEKIGPILQANGIESGDDPRFQNVLVKALATQRMLVDLEAPTPEARAETRKQREADILAAFGETASTAIGANTGAIEPVIQRSSVTPNLETRTLEGEAQPVILPETAGGQAGTIALSPEDLVARQQGFEPLVGITTDKGPVGNRFPSMQAAEFFLLGPKDAKTGQRSGGYAQTNLLGQGLEARIRQGKRSKAEGGGTFYFVETRKKPEAPVVSPVTPAITPATTPAAPVTTAAKTTKQKKSKAAAPAVVAPSVVAPAEQTESQTQPTQGAPDATQVRQVTEGGEQQRQGTGGQVPAVGEDRGVQAQKQEGGSQTGGGNQPVQSGAQPQVTERKTKDRFGNNVTEVTLPDGEKYQLNRLNSVESMGLPGWHDANESTQNSFLGNTKAEAIKELLSRSDRKKQTAAAPAPATPAAPAVTEKVDREGASKVAKSNFETAIDQANDPEYGGDIDAAFDAYRQNTADTLSEQGKKGSIEYADREFDRLVKEYKSKQAKPAAPAPAPAVDPAMQARVKERLNKAYEDGALELEELVALNEMVDQGNLMGAISQMKRLAETNKGVGAGAKYSLSRTAEPATTTRDFAYAKLKTVDDLNKEVRGHLARQGSTDSFTAKRVPIGDLAGKIPGIPAMQRIADLFGKKLVYFAVAEGSIDFLDGAVLSGSDTIFVNVNSSRPHIRILGHEMVHALRFSDKKLYAQLVTQLTPYLDQAGMSRYRQIMAQEGMKDPALILEEAIADIVGDRFGESSFWQMMADDNPTMFQQLARVVLNFLDSVMAKIRSKQTLDSKNLLTDITAARQAVVSVLSTFEQKQTAAPTTQQEGVALSTKKPDTAQPTTQGVSRETRPEVRSPEPVIRPGARGDEGSAAARQAGGGDRGGRTETGSLAPLEGSPSVQGFSGPDPRIVAVAERYAEENGIEYTRQTEYVQVDEDRARRIADAYDKMEHAPQDPVVKEAYENLIRQTRAQYDALVAAGYRFWFTDLNIEQNLEYLSSPWNAMRDIRANKTMGVFPTDEGYGTGEFDSAANPMLVDTGLVWPVGSANGTKTARVLANDLFRAVHDAFGHGLEGAGFRARGEENAWLAHTKLFTGSAVGAITSETRGQNSWLNYGPYGEQNRTAAVTDTVFADQKTGLMPEWTWAETSEPAVTDFKGGVVLGNKQAFAVEFTGVHYGKALTDKLRGDKYGTGLKGAERKRLDRTDDDRIKKRVYFYIPKPDNTMPPIESGVGNYVYTQKFKNILGPGSEQSRIMSEAMGDSNTFESLIVDAGYDGYAVPNMGVMVILNYDVPVNYKGTRAELSEKGEPIMFSRKREGETFYSAMERGFESVKQTSMPAQQWKAWLNSNKAQLGIKNAEIEWTGINEWFDLQEGKVEKQAVLNWIAGNKVRINDIILTDNPSVALPEYKDPTEEDYREFVRDRIEEQKNNVERTVFGSDFYDLEKDYPELYKVDPDSMTMEEAKQWIQDYSSMAVFNREHIRGYERSLGRARDRLKARHNTERLTLPDGKDYAEIILTDPSIQPYKDQDSIHFGDVAYGKHIGWLRTNVRKDADGNDVLFLEEIQSQRAQEGRERGIADSKKTDLPEGFTAYQNEKGEWYVINDSTKKQVGLYGKTRDEAIESMLREGVPNAPFIKETKAWTALLLKRAIAYAQSKGIDRVAWTTGDQQNDRYKLSQVVDEVYYEPGKGETYQITAIKNGSEIDQGSGWMDLDTIRRTYGKDIAKLISDGGGEKYGKGGVIRGENLNVGGAGMREFYNTIVPSVAKEITKTTVGPMYVVTREPYMGARLQVVQQEGGKYQLVEVYKGLETPVSKMFDTYQEADNEKTARYEAESKGATPQMGFIIPEKLQEQVANDGFPMFSRKRYEEQFSDVSPDTRERALKKGFYSPPTIKERLEHIKPNFWMRIVQGTFDKFRSVKDISNKAYLMLRMSTGSQDGAVSTLLHYGQVFNDDGALNVKKGTQGLLEILDPVGGEVDRFLLWIAANRAASLSKDERERFFSPEDIKALRALNLGTMKDGKSRVGVYAETLKNMNELNRSVLDVARDTGLIDAEGYKRFSADIWYIPFYRQMEDDGSLSAAQTSSGSVGQYLSKKLKGSDRPLNDLMENVLMNWTHILSASMKNQAAVETLTAATQMGDIVTKLDAQEKGAVKVMIKGQETYYRIDDEFLLESLSAVSQMPSYGWGMDIMRGFKTTLTRFISLSPTFKINNLIRDSIQSIGLSELSGNPIGNVMQGWRAYKDERAEALAGGGLFAMGNAFDGDQSASVKRLLKTGVNKADILDTPDKVANFFRTMQDKYDEVSDASENANRLALYQQLRANGASHLEASYAARDLQDFGLQGSWAAIRYAAQVLPYFNARLQGMYKLGRDGIDPTMQVLTGNASDTERQKAAKFATVTGAVVTAGLILYLSQKDDEDWKKREDWDRDAFFWFKVPGTDKAVRIPKPFEMGAIATLVERFTEQMVDSSVEGKVFAKRLGAVLHDTFAINPIPQVVRPLWDIARNKDGFTDRPIESMGMERISPQLRKSPGTSAAAVSLNTVNNMFAQFASAATGGAIKPESVQFSAIQYDYMIKGYLGWVGAGIQTASNMMATPFKDGASPRYERIDDFLVVGNYVKTVPQAQSRYVTSFYENAKDIATAASDVSHFMNAGQLEKASELLTENQDKLALVKLYNKGTNMMSSISSQIRMVEDDKEMSGAEKRLEIERLQQIRIDIAKQVEEIRINQKK